ncbi:MAG: hypothetical protein GY851_10350 [bacterium]|nr:hypothetical protein [bacterium]
MREMVVFAGMALLLVLVAPACFAEASDAWGSLEAQFRDVPMEARRLTGPLFWLHGDDNETPERLASYLEKVAEGNNGSFCAESRPHSDWLGPRWYHDLDVCLETAKRLDLRMWIFDDAWWPSQTMGRRVPEQYGAKRLTAAEVGIDGGSTYEATDLDPAHLVAVIAGREAGDGVDGDSLIDLTDSVKDGALSWKAPAGKWRIMTFVWELAPVARQNGQRTLDGASQDCVDWFMDTVYQPHYDRYREDFGEHIVGFFYDEPETQGDWGTEVDIVLSERGVDRAKALVAWKFKLAGDEQIAARYAYVDALFEAWGRTMYGTMTDWCEERDVASIGHFMDHGFLYLDHGLGAGNMFQMQKYSSMGGMDLVVNQLYPGQRVRDIYQLPKLTSSISHVYAKKDDLAMCEIFGAYGQHLTYPEMKWLVDQHQVRGVNFMITHSFNPKAPNDTDCPPYFYNDGQEPRWPLYRVWADYTNRLSLLLHGGRHVCPVALLFCGNSAHVGRAVKPEDFTTALQDALYDCDWMPYDVFADDAEVDGEMVRLHDEAYRVLVVPPVEAIPYDALVKAKQFLDAGGVVVGYGLLPTKSATLGKSSEDIAAVRDAIWGSTPDVGDKPWILCGSSPAGGRAYLMSGTPTPEDLTAMLAGDANVQPVIEVLEGDTGHWLHALHRVKDGRDVFLVCNQDHKGEAKQFRLRANVAGTPECWDAMRNTFTALKTFGQGDDGTEFALTLEPNESVVIVFRDESISRPPRIDGEREPLRPAVAVKRSRAADAPVVVSISLRNTSWVWYSEGKPGRLAFPGKRWFRTEMTLPDDNAVTSAPFLLSADNEFVLHVNGVEIGRNDPGLEAWRTPKLLDMAKALRPGVNAIAIEAVNATDQASPAGLIGAYHIEFADGARMEGAVDSSWTSSKEKARGWAKPGFDDSGWKKAREVAVYGDRPWGPIGSNPILLADPFIGECVLPNGSLDGAMRACLEMEGVQEGAAVHINGSYAGGCIGAPFRLDVTRLLKPGKNTVEIEPYAPRRVQVAFYPAS